MAAWGLLLEDYFPSLLFLGPSFFDFYFHGGAQRTRVGNMLGPDREARLFSALGFIGFLHLDGHWSLLLVDLARFRVTYFDPCNIRYFISVFY